MVFQKAQEIEESNNGEQSLSGVGFCCFDHQRSNGSSTCCWGEPRLGRIYRLQLMGFRSKIQGWRSSRYVSSSMNKLNMYNSIITIYMVTIFLWIVFKYTSGLHSVVELGGESAYKSCDLGTALNSMNTGNDVVKLNKPGTRYFACGTLGHCGQGMKVKITVESGTAPSTPESPSSSSSSSPAASSASAMHSYFAAFVLLTALVATSLLYMF